MTQKKINRINELYKKSRTCTLSAEELCEQKKLREEYRAGFKNNLIGQLENTTILEPDGTKIPVKDLKKD